MNAAQKRLTAAAKAKADEEAAAAKLKADEEAAAAKLKTDEVKIDEKAEYDEAVGKADEGVRAPEEAAAVEEAQRKRHETQLAEIEAAAAAEIESAKSKADVGVRAPAPEFPAAPRYYTAPPPVL